MVTTKLSQPVYNTLFAVLSSFTAPPAAVVVAKSKVDLIRSNADEGNATEISLDWQTYELEHILAGILHLVSGTVKVADLDVFEGLAKQLRIGKAFSSELAKLVPHESKLELDSTMELDAENEAPVVVDADSVPV